MGWPKYYEDNISIYVGRMAMKESIPGHEVKREAQPIKRASEINMENSFFVAHPKVQNGRRGLELVFPYGVEEVMIRKLQMNGWWWSKANACWCNLDTKANRKYAETLLHRGAKLSVVT